MGKEEQLAVFLFLILFYSCEARSVANQLEDYRTKFTVIAYGFRPNDVTYRIEHVYTSKDGVCSVSSKGFWIDDLGNTHYVRLQGDSSGLRIVPGAVPQMPHADLSGQGMGLNPRLQAMGSGIQPTAFNPINNRLHPTSQYPQHFQIPISSVDI